MGGQPAPVLGAVGVSPFFTIKLPSNNLHQAREGGDFGETGFFMGEGYVLLGLKKIVEKF